MDQSRPPGCTCISGASPICPAEHRPTTPEPGWVRYAREHGGLSPRDMGFIVIPVAEITDALEDAMDGDYDALGETDYWGRVLPSDLLVR